MIKSHPFYEDLYKQHYCYLKGWTREQAENFLEISFDGAGGITVSKGNVIFIWVEDAKKNPSHLTHECIHAANFCLKSRGVKISTKNDEAQAYLVEWILLQCTQRKKKA
jgi:hypothetical protein